MQYKSIVQSRNSINNWPEYNNDRIYMRPFYKKDGLQSDIKQWQGVVDTMLDSIDTDLPIYLMVDQSVILAGQYHRRAGVHIDGYWGGSKWQHLSAHGGSHSHTNMPPVERHRGSNTHRSVPIEPAHNGGGGRHSSGLSDWESSFFDEPEAIILASNIAACNAYVGKFNGPVGDMGDCSKIDLTALQAMPMESDLVYAGNVTMLHETLPCVSDCYRTVVRLNVPGWTPSL